MYSPAQSKKKKLYAVITAVHIVSYVVEEKYARILGPVVRQNRPVPTNGDARVISFEIVALHVILPALNTAVHQRSAPHFPVCAITSLEL